MRGRGLGWVSAIPRTELCVELSLKTSMANFSLLHMQQRIDGGKCASNRNSTTLPHRGYQTDIKELVFIAMQQLLGFSVRWISVLVELSC